MGGLMGIEQYGRWTTHSALQPYGAPDNKLALSFLLLALNEYSKGLSPGPIVAKIAITRIDGSPIGTFDVDSTDAEALAKSVSQLSDDRFGPIERAAIESLRGLSD